MIIRHLTGCGCSRRDFLRKGLYGVGVAAGLPVLLERTTAALTAQALAGTSIEAHRERILVVVELSGGNDGLNTVPSAVAEAITIFPVAPTEGKSNRI